MQTYPSTSGEFQFWNMPTTFDLYFIGVRGGADDEVALPADSDIEQIRAMLPMFHRAARLPLRVVAALVKDEERHQRIVMPFWLFLLGAGSFHRAARS